MPDSPGGINISQFFFFLFPSTEAMQGSEDFSVLPQKFLSHNGEELLAAGGRAACSHGGRHEAQRVGTEPWESTALEAPPP